MATGHDDHGAVGLGHGQPGAPDPPAPVRGGAPPAAQGAPGHGAVALHHDDHDDHPADEPGWVAVPLVVGLVLGIVLLLVLGLATDAAPFSTAG